MIVVSHNIEPLSPTEQTAIGIVQTLRDRGYTAYIVGGSVRDRLLNLAPTEVDVATDATPDVIEAMFPKTVAVGKAFGVMIVLMDDQQIEVATFREDREYMDGRHPVAVRYSDPEHDAQRRDFTINALFADPLRGEIIDYVNGVEDLRQGVIRAIGEPEARFREDYLRMLRAIRFSARFGFAIEPATFAAIQATAAQIQRISPERIFNELDKILVGPNPDRAFRLLDESGLLPYVLPEVAAMKGVPQPPAYHPEGDVWEHTLLLLKNLDRPSSVLAWSALLHDVGKPPTLTPHADDGRPTFPAHAKVGADMAVSIFRRLHCANEFIDQVDRIVYYHMAFAEVKQMKRSTLKRLLARPTFPVELELHRLDCLACHRNLGNYEFLLDTIKAFGEEPVLPPPLLNGRDVLAKGIPPGPKIGVIIRELEELQLGEEITTKEQALAWLDQRVVNEPRG